MALLALLPTLAAPTPATSTAEPTAEPTAARAAASRLAVSPKAYVPGQAVRFRGALGRPGKRAVHLQSHLGRPGDTWQVVPGSRSRTDAAGRFDFRFPAPSMFDIRYRVAGGGRATRPYLFNARPPEITLRAPGSSGTSPVNPVSASRPFTVLVDTTPRVRGALGRPPAFPGRTVTLQERVDGNRWRTIDTGTTDQKGHVSFTVTAPDQGARVLRARQERWTRGENEIGWFASFPAYFTVGAIPARDAAARVAAATPVAMRRAGVRPTASQRLGWGPSLFDFAWERGQDLGSPPSRGTRLRGGWQDTSDGTGRATPFNGGLVLQSKLEHRGPGDLGTSTATLQGNALSAGRWEFRVQGHVWERRGSPYRFRLELVPEGSEVVTCAPESIVVAGFTMGARGMQVGVRSQAHGTMWRRTVPGARLDESPMNVGVEVTGGHVTWFADGRPVATLKDPRARLGARLVPRLSLVGKQREMAGAQVDSDWQRAWTLDRGRPVTSGPGLRRQSYSAGC